MSALDVPENGLSLCRHAPGTDATTKPTNAMRLNLAQTTVDDLIQSLRENKLARIRFGKHQTLYYGSNSQHFHSAPEAHRSEIYTYGSTTDKENVYFTGVLSHRLEVQKAREATAATDQALANLEQSLNAYEQGKESKRTHMIDDISQVKALRSGPGKPSGLLRTPASKVEREKDRLLKTSSANRSLSSSPGMSVSRSPASVPALTPTSAPATQNKDRIRLDALKVPFIHLLAVRAVSVKFLARQTRTSLDDCTTLTQKYGVENRLNRDKFDLKDKAYKELDVWNFPYPSQEDRQEAIENAISAFDRMRISRSDKQWQMLLPKEERGKGKCLSRLNLSTGPIKKSATSRVDDSAKDGDTTGHETDRASTSGVKTAATQRKRTGEKDSAAAKKAPAKSKNTTNSTLTGRVTKKTERKPAPKPDAKIKSAEYVHESDEDEDTEMLDLPATSDKTQEKTDTTEKPQPKPVTKRDVSIASGTTRPAPSKVDKSERPPSKPDSKTSSHQPPAKTALKKPPSSRASNSPQKPSPLGSSPPTNASEIHSHSRSSSQNHAPSGTSSSSSPLISQVSRPKQQQSQQQSSKTTTGVTKAALSNGAVKSTLATNPLKRKAEPDKLSARQSHTTTNGSLEHKRRRAPSTSSGSTGSASPPMSYELLRQQLREKSQKFKQRYAKYRALYETMARHPNPPRADLDKLQDLHAGLQQTKKEIWDEDRRLRAELRR